MKAIVSGCISIAYLCSVFALPSLWNRAIDGIAIRFDLSPEQTLLVPMGLNIFAALLGIPAVLGLFRRPDEASRKLAQVAFSAACSVAVVLLVIGTVRWAITEPDQVASGIRESLAESEDSGAPVAVIEDDLFRDSSLGLEVALPEDWEVLSTNAIRRAHAAGSRSISSAGTTPTPSNLPEGVEQFLAIKKFPEAHDGYNPSLAFVSYEKVAMQRSGCSDLNGLISPLASSGPPFTVLSGPSPSTVGPFQAIEVRLRGDFPGATIQQYVYGFEVPTHYVTVTAAFQLEEDYDIMSMVLRSVNETN